MSRSVAVVCDFAEEQWISMDHVADMLARGLSHSVTDTVDVQCIRPAMIRVAFSNRPTRLGRAVGRAYNRYLYYPWYLRQRTLDADVFHVIDHSYAHLVHQLPAERTVVTCHDIDVFRCLLGDGQERRSWLFRRIARRILAGMQKAAAVVCVSSATRDELLKYNLADPRRLHVIHNAVDPAFTPKSNPEADREVERLLGPAEVGVAELLHVGSIARRKRLDVLLQVVTNLRRRGEAVRLIRVGPELTPEMRKQAKLLAAAGAIRCLPFLPRDVLAALYRRATLLLQTSEAEGFGLPVVEAMACGLTVVASDLPVLREVGGSVAHYCPSGDVTCWSEKVASLLRERRLWPASTLSQYLANVEQASGFSLEAHAAQTLQLYKRLAPAIWTATATAGAHFSPSPR